MKIIKRILIAIGLIIGLFFLVMPVFAATVASPIRHWKMNDNTSTSVVVDAMGTTNGVYTDGSGAINTDTGSVAGKINTALDFDGGDEYMKATTTLGSGTYSVSMRAYIDAIGAGDHFLVDARTSVGTGYFYYGANTLSVTSGTVYVNNVQTLTISTGSWLHIVVTGITLDVTNSILFGGKNNLTEFHDGKLDDIRLYDFALTTADIAAIYNNGDGTEDENPVIVVPAGQVIIMRR